MNLRGNPFYLTEEENAWVARTLERLTDEERVGQLLCVMGQDYAPEELARMVREECVGGVLFRPEKADSIRARYAALDEAACVPLLHAANLEEGGSGGASDAMYFAWPMTVAATDDPGMAARFGAVCGAEGRAIGVDWNFAPVSDLDLNFRNPIINVRSYGSDLSRVLAMTAAYVDACQARGVACCAKHFPGDGVDFRDQHLHPTYNSLSAKAWWESYGTVYRTLIDRGLLSVMVGHIVQPAVAMEQNPALTFERCLPASLSGEMLTGVLRGRLGFNGVIATDATIMGGFTQAMARRDAIPAAIMAGNDMLVFSTDEREDRGYLLDALEQGTLTRERLAQAVTRILALKAVNARPPRDSSPVDAKGWRKACAEGSATLVKDTQPGVLPLTPDKFHEIRLIPLGKDETLEGSMTALVREALESRGFRVTVFDEAAQELHGTAALDPRRLTLYLCNLETASNQTSVRIHWMSKHALNNPRHVWEEPSVFVSFANPYHLQDVPRVKTYVNAYSCHRDTIRAVVSKLCGESAFVGVSPVDAFCGLPDARL